MPRNSTGDAAGDRAGEAPAAEGISYNPAVLTDWDSNADPGNVEGALDQLAERVDDAEGEYVLIDGTRALTGDWNAGGQKITTRYVDINPGGAFTDVLTYEAKNSADDVVTACTVNRGRGAGVGGVGLGVRHLIQLENDNGDLHGAARYDVVWEDASAGTEDASLGFSLMVAGGWVELLKLSGVGIDLTRQLDMNTHKIVGVVDPTADQEVATKKFVDDHAPQAHKDSHDPGGADGLDVATPTDIGTANAAGSAASFVRSDHVHKIPDKWRTRSFLVEVPTPADDDEFIVHWFPLAATLTQVRVHVKAATSTTFELTERGYDTPDAGGTDISAAAITATTTPTDVTMNNTGMAANSVLVYHSSAVVGTPGKVWIFGKYTVD
ncbi:MAG: hypothetical protein KAV00_02025 [Phycisphaerae bacterium]|nr:hypothetical protein [Phycisphaerae bacterium]